MKKFILNILLIVLIPYILLSQNLNDAKRYLKLANTYITSENFDKANQYLNQAKEIIAKYNGWEANYWDAVSDETLGNLYLKTGISSLAEISYETALKKYKKLLHTKEGSHTALDDLLAKIKGLESTTLTMNHGNSKVIALDNTNKAVENLELPPATESFSCNNCRLKQFPYSVLQSNKIRTVVLSNNRIREFTPQRNNNLEYLDLSNNRLKEINGSLNDLSKLRYLDLSNNSLKQIPVGLTELKGLKVLKLTGNKIPFSMIKNLIQSMPNTLIIHDNYILEEPEAEEEAFPSD